MTTVTLPDGDEAEAEFEITGEWSDNGHVGRSYERYWECTATLDTLDVYSEDGLTLTREAAIARYGEIWVCGIEEDELQ